MKLFPEQNQREAKERILQKNYQSQQRDMQAESQFYKVHVVQLMNQYFLGGGNNVELVRRILAIRDYWIETKDYSSMFVNFKWQ
jgi:hypothetical protein